MCDEAGVESLLAIPEGIETTERVKDDQTYLFVWKDNKEEVTIELQDSQYKEVLRDGQVSSKSGPESKRLVDFGESVKQLNRC